MSLDCQQDHETAASAVRNLNSTDVGGRPLRIDLADSDPFLEGKTTVHGEIIDSGETRAQWREREKRERHDDYPPSRNDAGSFLRALPIGIPPTPGTTALDAITQTLATINPGQILEVLAQMKAFVINHPEQARMLLVAHPQLAHALFQALVIMNIVDPAVLERMRAAHSATPPQAPQAVVPPPMPPMPPVMGQAPAVPPQYPPHFQQMQQPPSMQQSPNLQQQPPSMQPPYYQAGPPPIQQAASVAPPVAAPPATSQINFPPNMDSTQRAMLEQVLALSPDQIPNLPPNEREAIMKLRAQFLGGANPTN
ncbi:hypothetical protein EW145_g3838 [Phellinidium pouzarii]|uniref:Cleavage stimulation factor subunit 2 hinge domain-containing protein n=1 Tax=Phellinidium pouzarii TaxID=167371 RepID=A0A4S4L650_9AGAM|nr:hypothetical protein EW145_g3838 [Phellinidium pouzarii]